jgi:hypothetical protein
MKDVSMISTSLGRRVIVAIAAALAVLPIPAQALSPHDEATRRLALEPAQEERDVISVVETPQERMKNAEESVIDVVRKAGGTVQAQGVSNLDGRRSSLLVVIVPSKEIETVSKTVAASGTLRSQLTRFGKQTEIERTVEIRNALVRARDKALSAVAESPEGGNAKAIAEREAERLEAETAKAKAEHVIAAEKADKSRISVTWIDPEPQPEAQASYDRDRSLLAAAASGGAAIAFLGLLGGIVGARAGRAKNTGKSVNAPIDEEKNA